MIKKITYCLLLLLVCSISAFSQDNISVASFRLLENDLTANTYGTMEKDQNGEVASLIKIVTTEQGFTYEGGVLGITKVKQEVGEIWVYVPHGIKKITIKHPQLGVLRDYYFQIPIEKARTYEMVLTTGKVITFVERKAEKQYVSFKVSPSNAVVELDTMILDVDQQGFAEKSVPYGTYDYRVSCANYHTEAGKVTIAEDKVEKTVTLRPNFGWIKFEGAKDFHGAHIYVNNERVGQLPLKTDKLVSGTYRVKVNKPLYKPYEQQVVVTDDSITTLNVSLVPNFANITLKTDAQSDIWIDGRQRGRGECTIGLEPGEYTVEVKRPSHRTVSDVITISELTDRTIKLSSPTPIYGSLEVESAPSRATIYVDGVDKGTTAMVINKVLIGSHKITLKKEGYKSYEQTVVVKEGETTTLTAELSPALLYGSLDVKSVPLRATIYVDGVDKGTTPKVINDVLVGSHKITLKKEGYESYEETVDVKEGKTATLTAILSEEEPVRTYSSYTNPFSERARMVDVKITSSPSNAMVQVDGKAVGTTPMNLSLKAGKYTFYTSKEGYYPKEIQQEVGPSMSGVHLNMNKIVRNKPSHNKAYKNSLYFEGNAEALMNIYGENILESPFYSYGGGFATGYYIGGVNAEVALQLNEEYLQAAFRIGRGYLLGRNMMITPQIGLTSFYDVEYLYDSMELDLYEYEDLCLSFSCRFHYCFSEKVALSITPECVFYSIDEEAFLSRDYYQSTMGLFLRVGLYFNRKW